MEQARIEAAAAGEPRYRGKPCRICGCNIRYVANMVCIDCNRMRQRKFQDKIRQSIKEARNGTL